MKVAIIGYGKMGKTIEGLLASEPDDEVLIRIDRDNFDDFQSDTFKSCDVAIEFSRPEAAVENLKACFEAGVPVVSGTTGWLDDFDSVKSYCDKHHGAFFYAPNFSIGVNIFFALNKWLAERMVSFDVYKPQMLEIHHTEKLDSPSGTAIRLAEDILDAYPSLKEWINEESKSSDKLGILSKREEDVKGTHEISYTSDVDCIKIEHRAFSREGFAAGAIAAARFLIGKHGFFDMNDLLQSKIK